MKALVLSGGASKGAFTAGVVQHLLEKERMSFDMAVGTSTGSLVAGPALLGDSDYLANVYSTVANKDIFKNTLLGKIVNMPIDAKMEPLHDMLREYYIEQGALERLLRIGKNMLVTTVNVSSGLVHLLSSEGVAFRGRPGMKPETFVKAILASCCEPVFTEPVRVFEDEPDSPFKRDLFYDGGVKEFLPVEHAATAGAREVWAVSTHRLEHSETDWGSETAPDKVSVLKALTWTVSAALDEVARGDRYRANVYLHCRKVAREIERLAETGTIDVRTKDQILQSVTAISGWTSALDNLYLIYPAESMSTSLEFNERIMMGYLRAGRKAAREFIAAGRPEFTDATLATWKHQEESDMAGIA